MAVETGSHDIGTLRENMATVQKDIALMLKDVARILRMLDGNGHKGLVERVGGMENDIEKIATQHDDEKKAKIAADGERRKFYYGVALIVISLIVSNIWLAIQIASRLPLVK